MVKTAYHALPNCMAHIANMLSFGNASGSITFSNILTTCVTLWADKSYHRVIECVWEYYISISKFITNYIHYDMWDAITCPFSNFNGACDYLSMP